MARIVHSITELIGNTPIVKVFANDTAGRNLFLKLESFNPGGSTKDRVAVQVLGKPMRKLYSKRLKQVSADDFESNQVMFER